jgi:hypothetical protein
MYLVILPVMMFPAEQVNSNRVSGVFRNLSIPHAQ